MEVEKRKKRVIKEEVEEGERERLKKLKEEREEPGAGAGTAGMPSEEEVEEFFAILRRMKVAVKYFDERGRRGREALEQTEIKLDDDGENADDPGGDDGDDALPLMKKKEGKDEVAVTINTEVLDLNAVAPEADESGGA